MLLLKAQDHDIDSFQKDGVKMHRVASDRSWPCRVIGWGDAFNFSGALGSVTSGSC